MSKIKKSILNILKLLIPDDLLIFLFLFLGVEQGKLIKFVIKRYDINGNFVDDFYESEVFNL